MLDGLTQRVSRYIAFGVVVCLIIAVPWVILETLVSRLPYFDELRDLCARGGTLGTVFMVAVCTLVLFVLGLVARRYFWVQLLRIPIVGNLLDGADRLLADLTKSVGRPQGRVAWVAWPSEDVRTIGILIDTVTSVRTTEQVAVYMLPTSGDVRSGMLRIVSIDMIELIPWTIDDALAFVSSGGTVRPVDPESSPADA